jgi:hypothetical protein
MGWKTITSVAFSVVSIGAHALGLSCASSLARGVAEGGSMNRTIASVSDAATLLAIVLSLLALALAVLSWHQEPQWARLGALYLAIGASLWSFVMV